MFVDSDGGKWTFRPNGKNLRKFEERTGILLFKDIGAALPDDLTDFVKTENGKVLGDIKMIANLFTAVFRGIGDAMALLFACRKWAGDDAAPKLDYDTFCERIAGEKIGEAIIEAGQIMMGCVNGMTVAASLTARNESDSKNPLEGSGGETSSPLPG